MEELDEIKDAIFRESGLKEWLDKEIRSLEIGGSKPKWSDFYQEIGSESIGKLVRSGSLDCTLFDYLSMISFLSSYKKESERKAFRSEALEKYIEFYQKRQDFLTLERNIKSGLCKDNYVIPRKKFQRYSSLMKSEASAQIDAAEVFMSEANKDKLTHSGKSTEYSLSKRQRKMLDLLRKDTAMTYVDLSKRIKCSRAVIAQEVAQLKKLGLLKRVGSDKTGYWEVTSRHG
jgi:biotin operon repressor